MKFRRVFGLLGSLLLVIWAIVLYFVFAAQAQTSTVVNYEREVELVVTVGGRALVLVPADEAEFLAIDLSAVTGMSVMRTIVFETADGAILLAVQIEVEERLRIVRNEVLVEVEPTVVAPPPPLPTATIVPITTPTPVPIISETTGLRAEKVGDRVNLYLTHAQLGLSGFSIEVRGSIVSFQVPEFGLVNIGDNEVTAVDLNELIEPGSGDALLFFVVVEVPDQTVSSPGALTFTPAAFDDDAGDPIEVAPLRIDF